MSREKFNELLKQSLDILYQKTFLAIDAKLKYERIRVANSGLAGLVRQLMGDPSQLGTDRSKMNRWDVQAENFRGQADGVLEAIKDMLNDYFQPAVAAEIYRAAVTARAQYVAQYEQEYGLDANTDPTHFVEGMGQAVETAIYNVMQNRR